MFAALKQLLTCKNVENPSLEARILLRHFAGVSDADIITDNIKPFDDTELQNAVSRRIAGEPLGRILGMREFYGLNFSLSPATLEPRPDTETLVEAVLQSGRLKNGGKILDLGTGSGCIILSILKNTRLVQGVAIDLAPAAVETARLNAENLELADRVKFIVSDWDKELVQEESFDVIVSNPPYIRSDVIPNLDENVKNYDPILALDGGADGLEAYKKILTIIKNRLAEDGAAYLEIGYDQYADMQRLVPQYGLNLIQGFSDLGGHLRVVKIGLGDKKN